MTTGPAEHEITPVLVTYNSARILAWSLPALAACQHVIIVDNGSQDDTVEVAQRLLPQAQVLRMNANLGFGRANNAGLAAVTTPYALLINPDGQLGPQSLTHLHEAARRYPEAAMLAPVLFDAPEVVGDFFRGAFWLPASKPAPRPEGDLCCDFVTGAAMLLNMRWMREVGYFDPWFFLYCEDDDLCLRVRRAKHPIVVVGNAQIVHRTRESSTPSARNTFRRIYAMTLSKFYITRKYLGTPPCHRLMVRIGVSSLLSLPFQLLLLRKAGTLKHLARLAAALTGMAQMNRKHCTISV